MEITTNIKQTKTNKGKKSSDNPKNHLEKFSEIGFIGCIEAESDLAKNTEYVLNQEMKKSQCFNQESKIEVV